ncbi:hypothetical protein EDB89DRAFT_2199696 [Lactarius sanguifluus]|nr:hypothetical protein EDB89DRAFT_2199696 [Lactarius sanguifluus]
MSRPFYSPSLRMVSFTPSSDVCALRLPKRVCEVKEEQVDWGMSCVFARFQFLVYIAAIVLMPHQNKIERIFRPSPACFLHSYREPSIIQLDVQHGFISRSTYNVQTASAFDNTTKRKTSEQLLTPAALPDPLIFLPTVPRPSPSVPRKPDLPRVRRLVQSSHITSGLLTLEDAEASAATADVDLLLGSTALQEELAAQPALMTGQLCDYRGKALGTTCLTISSIVIVAIALLDMFFVIWFT